MHKYIRDNGFQVTRALETALVDMYAKYRNIEFVYEVFGETKHKGYFYLDYYDIRLGNP
jgi:hypothetical protein